MYHYALTTKTDQVESENWQRALKASKLKRIEYSCPNQLEAAVFRRRAAVLKSLSDAGELEVASIHIPFWPFDVCEYFAADDESVRRRVVSQIREFIELHYGELGCRNFTLHASGEPIPDAEREILLGKVRRTLTELAGWLPEGLSINVELLPRSCIGDTPEELLALAHGLPDNIGFCLDVNHVGGRFSELPEIVKQLSGRLRAMHLSDFDGVDETHWYPGQGVIDWEKLMAAIRSLENELLLIFEITPIQAPAHQNRSVDCIYHFRLAEFCAFYLENISELKRRVQESNLP